MVISTMSLVWFLVFVVLIIIETLTAALVSVWGAASALVMIFLSMAGFPVVAQILVFLLLTIALIFLTRPLVAASRKKKEQQDTLNTLVGITAILQAPITSSAKGELSTPNGVSWQAGTADGTELEAGSVCTVVGVQGNTLIVELKKH